jgi:DNA polymerase-3 subunit gamma/tau
VLVFQISKGDTRLLEVSESENATLAEQAALITPDALTHVMEVLTQTESNLRDAASKRIFIEVALMKAMEARHAVSLDTVLKRLHELRGDTGHSTGGSIAASPAATAAPVRPTAAPAPAVSAMAGRPVVPAAQEASDVDLTGLWPKLLEAIGRASPFARSYFIEAHPVSFAKNVLTIGFDPEFADHIAMVDNTKNHTLIATKLAELGHPGAQVKIVKAGRPDTFVALAPPSPAPEPMAPAKSSPATSPGAPAPSPAPAAKPVQLDPAEFKNDPLIKKALEVFKGTIVEVRA